MTEKIITLFIKFLNYELNNKIIMIVIFNSKNIIYIEIKLNLVLILTNKAM